MTEAEFLEKLEVLEKKYNLELCIHQLLEFGKGKTTIYRVIQHEDERNAPIPRGALDELNLLLLEKHRIKPKFKKRIKAFFARKKIVLRFPFEVSPTGLTFEEIKERQKAWALHCELAEISY